MKNFYIKVLALGFLIILGNQSTASFTKDAISNNKDSFQVLKWSCMKSNEERIAYLQKSLGFYAAKDFNYSLVHHYLLYLTQDREVELFFNKLYEFAATDSSQIITMSHVDKAFSYVMMNRGNQSMAKGIIKKNDQLAVDNLVQIVDNIFHDFFRVNPKKRMEVAWHESAHALEAVNVNKALVVSQLSLGIQGFLGGLFIAVPRSEPNLDNSVSMIFHDHAEKIDLLKSKINI